MALAYLLDQFSQGSDISVTDLTSTLASLMVPFAAWLAIVFIPGLVFGDRYELLWRVISVVPAVGFGAVSGALSEVPLTILTKRRRKEHELAPPKV